MSGALVDALAVLEPISMMVAIVAVVWMFLPLFARQPTAVRVLIVIYPAIAQVNRAIEHPTTWNIGWAVFLGLLPFVALGKPHPWWTRMNRAP